MLELQDAPRARANGNGGATLMIMGLFAKADVFAAAIAGAAVGAVSMFLLTASLVLKGAPPGVEVGPHLSAFATFWPGYSVTWLGSVIGALYAGAIGAGLGFAAAVFWNFTHLIIAGAAVLRGDWLEVE